MRRSAASISRRLAWAGHLLQRPSAPRTSLARRLSAQHTAHIYNANAEGVAKWSARIEKPHNLSMDGFMKHAEKVVGLGEKPFGRMGPVGATHLKDHAEKFGRF